ncbi:NAD(P)-binding protein [Xylariaceae sp. FL0804]|nr:NAD(P)-binding protein [Xylariaceae sp. FL0804]
MAKTSNKTLIFKKTPTGMPVPGEHLAVEDRPIDLDAAPPAAGLLVEVLYSSFDPYLRGRMRPADVKSYAPAFETGGPFVNFGVAKVRKAGSDVSKSFSPGDLVVGMMPIAEYAVVADASAARVRRVENPHGLDPAHFVGALGMPGLTAYSGLLEIGQPQKGETLFVSSAAGAVGQVVGQVGKELGLRVVGSAGSQEKCDFVTRELGFDGCFNYKTEEPLEALGRLCPDGVDIYFENVGGKQLEAALEKMNTKGRIPVCGMISGYNTPPSEQYGIKNTFYLVAKLLKMQGFLVGQPEFGEKYAKEHQEKVSKWLADGTFKAKLSVTDGIDRAAEGFVGMLKGENFGKAVVKIR